MFAPLPPLGTVFLLTFFGCSLHAVASLQLSLCLK